MMDFQLDQQSPVPLYFQIKDQIRNLILSGELKPGDMIPPEDILGRQLQVSRMTVRHALGDLSREGLLIRKRAIGTIVASPRQDLPLFMNRLVGLTEEMSEKGVSVASRVLLQERQQATYEIRQHLKLQYHEPVILIRRLRSTNHFPLVIENSYHPKDRFPDLLETDFTDRSIYQFLWDRYQVQVHQSEDSFVAGIADLEESKLLEIDNGAPVMRYQRIGMDGDGVPIEFTLSIYRADRFRFVVNYSRNPEDNDNKGTVSSYHEKEAGI
jgi:GntR family transcriptional regulator